MTILSKLRLLFLVAAALSFSVISWSWFRLLNDGRFFYRAGIFAPMGAIVTLYFGLFPERVRSRQQSWQHQILGGVILLIGLLLGILNLYAMWLVRH